MDKWTLKIKKDESSFSSGDSLLEYVKKELYRILSESPLSDAVIEDSDGTRYDIQVDIGLKERDR